MEFQSTSQILSNQLISIPERKKLLKSRSLKLIKFSLISFLAFFVLPISALAQNISWTGDGDGTSWSDPANWDENRVPGQADDVIVDMNGTYTVEQTGGITINSLTFGADEGTQTLRKTANTLTLNAESVLGPNALFIMEAGNLQGDGILTNEGTIKIIPINWTGILELTLINQGTIEHESGIFYLTNASLENQGRYEIQGDFHIFRSGGLGNFINSGDLVKTQGDETARITVSIDSRPESSIESAQGTLQIESVSSYHNTTFVANQENATVRFETGSHTFRGEITGNPVGLVLLNGASESHEDGATLNFGGTGLTWISNYMQVDGTVTNMGRIRLTAPNWTGIQGDRFINEGTIDHLGGIFYLTNAIFENRSLYNIRGDVNIFRNSSFGNFVNYGDLIKTEGEGLARVSASIDSRPESTIESVQGTLQIESASSFHNTTFVADHEDASVRFQGGRHTFRGDISGNPVGQIELNGPSDAHEDGATLNFGGTGLTWLSNYMNAGNSITNTGLIRLIAPNWTGIQGDTFINNGTIDHQSGIFYLTNAIFENRSLYNVRGNVNIFRNSSYGNFINDGDLIKTEGDGLARITASVDSRPESTIESVQGTLQIESGSSYHNTTFVADQEDASIRFEAGRHTFRGDISGNPVGQIVLNGPSDAHEEGATLNFGGTGLTWISNYMNVDNSITNAGLLRLQAPNWTGIQGDSFVNNGTVDHMSGIFYLSNGVFENRNIYNIHGDLAIFRNASFSTFINSGRLFKTDGNAKARISVVFDSRAGSSIESSNGTIQFEGNGSYHNSSLLVMSEETSIRFETGVHTFRGNFTEQPVGSIIINSEFKAHDEGVVFNITGSGLTWISSYFTQGGELQNEGLITLNAPNLSGINNSRLINNGQMLHLNGTFYVTNSAYLLNNNDFEFAGDFSLSSSSGNPGLFDNAGIFRKTGGEGISFISSDFINQPQSLFDIETGQVQIRSDFTLEQNALMRSGEGLDIGRGAFFNKGIFELTDTVQTFNYVGDYEPNDTSAVLDLRLGVTDDILQQTLLHVQQADYRINFSRPGGNATLAGKLSLTYENDFIPEAGQEFEIIRTDIGMTGGFSDLTDLVDMTNDVTFYPQIRDTSLFLVVYDGVPTLSGNITAEPTSIQAGSEQMIMFTGSGFPPDLSVQLTCLECNEPDLFGTITGRVGSISPDTARVWFDVSDPMISGTYQAVLTDPRGGSESTEISINQAPLELSVDILKQSTEGADNTGLFVIRSNRRSLETVNVPFSLFGSAQQYVHYTTDLLGDSFPFPAGSDSVVVSIVPLQTETPQTLTVGLQIEQVSQGPDVAFRAMSTFASMDIRTGADTNEDLLILNYTPDGGGNVGFVTMTVTGKGFTANSTLQLTGGEGGTIVAGAVEVNETGSKLTGQFNLIGRSVGSRNLVVNSGASQESTIPNAFTIEKGVYPDIFVQVLAPERVPRIRNRSYTILMQNQGNVDVTGFAVIAGFPTDTEWELKDGEVRLSNGGTMQWSEVVPARQDGDRLVIELPAVTLSAGASHKFEIVASIPQSINMQLIGGWIYR